MKKVLLVLFLIISVNICWAADIYTFTDGTKGTLKVSTSSSYYKTGSKIYFPGTITLTASVLDNNGTQDYYIYCKSDSTVWANQSNTETYFTPDDPIVVDKSFTGSFTLYVESHLLYIKSIFDTRADSEFTNARATYYFYKDSSGPTTPSISIDPTSWTNGSVTVSASSTDDGSGVKRYYYQVNGTNGQLWNVGSSVTVSSNCTVYFYSVDNVGNVSETASKEVSTIDKTAPTISSVTVPEGWLSSSSGITVDGSDSASGIADWFYNIDSGTWISTGISSSPCEITIDSEGSHEIGIKLV